MLKRVSIDKREKVMPRDVVAQTLYELAQSDPRVVMVDADLAKTTGGAAFASKMPDRHINVGIAEQSLVGVSAGMALSGLKVFAGTFSGFLTRRGCDQLTVSAAFNRAPVKFITSYSGLSQGLNGPTHISYEDIAITRAIPKMISLAPADPIEVREMIKWAYNYDEGPVYIRIPRGPMLQILPEDYKYDHPSVLLLREGKDVGIIAIGMMVEIALESAERLDKEGISVSVASMSSVKPTDEEAILELAEMNKLLITLEDHSIYGGIGEAVASILSERKPTRVVRMGMRDIFGVTLPFEGQLVHAGLTVDDVVNQVKSALERV